jgi:single-stranded-DNA-specific exonuclease
MGPIPRRWPLWQITYDLIICVDCGTLAHEALEAARVADVVVLDHHLGAETLPEARAVVNPNRQDETGRFGSPLRGSRGLYGSYPGGTDDATQGQTPPNLINTLDLVALATVADVAPLVGVNRAFVRQGLKVMSQRKRVGLNALSDVAGLNAAPSAYHLGYVLGPRINAGGRIGKADLGARLLACNTPHEAAVMADKLEELNTERRSVEAMVRLAALEQAGSARAGVTAGLGRARRLASWGGRNCCRAAERKNQPPCRGDWL